MYFEINKGYHLLARPTEVAWMVPLTMYPLNVTTSPGAIVSVLLVQAPHVRM
jgi:hypothetical protein